jgi:hypothetical protein
LNAEVRKIIEHEKEISVFRSEKVAAETSVSRD